MEFARIAELEAVVETLTQALRSARSALAGGDSAAAAGGIPVHAASALCAHDDGCDECSVMREEATAKDSELRELAAVAAQRFRELAIAMEQVQQLQHAVIEGDDVIAALAEQRTVHEKSLAAASAAADLSTARVLAFERDAQELRQLAEDRLVEARRLKEELAAVTLKQRDDSLAFGAHHESLQLRNEDLQRELDAVAPTVQSLKDQLALSKEDAATSRTDATEMVTRLYAAEGLLESLNEKQSAAVQLATTAASTAAEAAAERALTRSVGQQLRAALARLSPLLEEATPASSARVRADGGGGSSDVEQARREAFIALINETGEEAAHLKNVLAAVRSDKQQVERDLECARREQAAQRSEVDNTALLEMNAVKLQLGSSQAELAALRESHGAREAALQHAHQETAALRARVLECDGVIGRLRGDLEAVHTQLIAGARAAEIESADATRRVEASETRLRERDDAARTRRAADAQAFDTCVRELATQLSTLQLQAQNSARAEEAHRSALQSERAKVHQLSAFITKLSAQLALSDEQGQRRAHTVGELNTALAALRKRHARACATDAYTGSHVFSASSSSSSSSSGNGSSYTPEHTGRSSLAADSSSVTAATTTIGSDVNCRPRHRSFNSPLTQVYEPECRPSAYRTTTDGWRAAVAAGIHSFSRMQCATTRSFDAAAPLKLDSSCGAGPGLGDAIGDDSAAAKLREEQRPFPIATAELNTAEDAAVVDYDHTVAT